MIRARMTLAALLLVPSLALASVGQVSLLEGGATRTPKSGEAQALKVGSVVEVGDTLRVAPGGNMKLTLTDRSVLMVGEGSELRIDEARFKGLDREGFSAFLSVGKVWSQVSKALAGSDARFEVQTDRAVAGVRGTSFRVDAQPSEPAAQDQRPPVTVVRVQNGKVRVTEKQLASAATPAVGSGGKPKGARVRVGGPAQVTEQQWEARFVELQANQMYTVGAGQELWRAEPWTPARDDDAFARFVNKHAPSPGEVPGH